MSDLASAIEASKSLAKSYRGVLAVAEALEKLGSLEAALETAEANTKTARAAQQEAVMDLNGVQHELADAEKELQVSRDTKAAEEREADARIRSKLAGAEVDAERMLKDAKREQERLEIKNKDASHAHECMIAAMNSEAVDLSTKVNKLRDELAALKARLG